MTKIDAMEPAASGDVVALYGARRSGAPVMRLLPEGHPDFAGLAETDFMSEDFAPVPGGPCWMPRLVKSDTILRNSGLPVPAARSVPGALADLVLPLRHEDFRSPPMPMLTGLCDLVGGAFAPVRLRRESGTAPRIRVNSK